MSCNRVPGTGPSVTGGTFTNWAQNVSVNPQRIYTPTTVDEVVAIVKEAEANNARVRAVGSGWSFTDIMVTPDYLVYTDELKNTLSETMTGNDYPNDPVFGALTAGARKRHLYHVEAGIKIHDLYDRLESIGGVILNDGPGGTPKSHGYALPTLGGSGGQSIVGAISTSTHGGDMHRNLMDNDDPIPPIADMVQSIHLVAPGGAEFFFQRGGSRAIVDVDVLAQLMPCVGGPGQIISNDDVFNAVLVSMGRMGIIYSLVLEVREQYVLSENRMQNTWNTVSSGLTINGLRADNRFLQILILPYANPDGDHTCFVTTRNEVPQPSGPPSTAPGFDAFTFACELRPEGLAAAVASIIAALSAAIAALLLIPFVGPILAAADIALVTALTPLLNPFVTIGDYLATAVNILTMSGGLDMAKGLVNLILSSNQQPILRQDLSYKIMDTYNYKANCFKALSLEVAFNADNTIYLDYIQAVFNLIDEFASQNTLVGAYISLRYCTGSDALLGIEQWPHTVCIEFSALSGLANELQVLNAFEQEATNRGAKIHWGQLNSRSPLDIEAAFPGKIDNWRTTLAHVSTHGQLSTFDNDFCLNHGLEAFNVPDQPLTLIRFVIKTGDDDLGGGLNGSSATADVLLPGGDSFSVTLRNSNEPHWDNGSTHTVDFTIPNTVSPPLTQNSGIAGVRINLVQDNPDFAADNWDIFSLQVSLFNPGGLQVCQINLIGTSRLEDGSIGLVRLSKNPGSSGHGPSSPNYLTGPTSGCP